MVLFLHCKTSEIGAKFNVLHGSTFVPPLHSPSPIVPCEQKQLSKRIFQICEFMLTNFVNKLSFSRSWRKKTWRTTCISTILAAVTIHSFLLAGWWGPKLTDFLLIFLPRKREASWHSAPKNMDLRCLVFISRNSTSCSIFMPHGCICFRNTIFSLLSLRSWNTSKVLLAWKGSCIFAEDPFTDFSSVQRSPSKLKDWAWVWWLK